MKCPECKEHMKYFSQVSDDIDSENDEEYYLYISGWWCNYCQMTVVEKEGRIYNED